MKRVLAYVSLIIHKSLTYGGRSWGGICAGFLQEPSRNIFKYSRESEHFLSVWEFICVCGLWSNSCHSITLPLISACQEPNLWPVWELWSSRRLCWHMELMDVKPQGDWADANQETGRTRARTIQITTTLITKHRVTSHRKQHSVSPDRCSTPCSPRPQFVVVACLETTFAQRNILFIASTVY